MKITLTNLLKKDAIVNEAKMWNTGLNALSEPHAMEFLKDSTTPVDVNRDGISDYVEESAEKIAEIGQAVVTRSLYPINAEKAGTVAIALYGRYQTVWLAPEESFVFDDEHIASEDALGAQYYKKLASDIIGVTFGDAADVPVEDETPADDGE